MVFIGSMLVWGWGYLWLQSFMVILSMLILVRRNLSNFVVKLLKRRNPVMTHFSTGVISCAVLIRLARSLILFASLAGFSASASAVTCGGHYASQTQAGTACSALGACSWSSNDAYVTLFCTKATTGRAFIYGSGATRVYFAAEFSSCPAGTITATGGKCEPACTIPGKTSLPASDPACKATCQYDDSLAPDDPQCFEPPPLSSGQKCVSGEIMSSTKPYCPSEEATDEKCGYGGRRIGTISGVPVCVGYTPGVLPPDYVPDPNCPNGGTYNAQTKSCSMLGFAYPSPTGGTGGTGDGTGGTGGTGNGSGGTGDGSGDGSGGTGDGSGGTGDGSGDGSGGTGDGSGGTGDGSGGTGDGSGDGSGSGSGTGSCGGPGQPSCSVTIGSPGNLSDLDHAGPSVDAVSGLTGAFNQILSTITHWVDPAAARQQEFTQMFSDYLGAIPSSNCQPFNFGVYGGRQITIDHCPGALIISEVLGYAIWLWLAIGTFLLLTGNRTQE